MDFRITIEWDYESGISDTTVLPFLDGIELALKTKNYGVSLNSIWIVLVSRPYDFKQRKRFKKGEARLEYDIILDYFLIKNVGMEEKKNIIRRQIIEITEQTFSKYKFDNFNKAAFLNDLTEIVNSLAWQ